MLNEKMIQYVASLDELSSPGGTDQLILFRNDRGAGRQIGSISITNLLVLLLSGKKLSTVIPSAGVETIALGITYDNANWAFAGELIVLDSSGARIMDYSITNRTTTTFDIEIGDTGTVEGLTIA